MRIFYAVIFLFLLAGCSDNASITKSSKDLKDVRCMRLVVFPPNKFLTTTMQSLYNFDDNCSYKLEVSQKNGIVCNSNQNADKKILADFPSGYIRIDLLKGAKNIFSYYRDLTHRAKKEDVTKAFDSLKKELH